MFYHTVMHTEEILTVPFLEVLTVFIRKKVFLKIKLIYPIFLLPISLAFERGQNYCVN